MNARRAGRTRAARHGERGQTIMIFAVSVLAVIAMAGLLIDSGLAWSNRRQAQAAADTMALATAKAIVASGAMTPLQALQTAQPVAQANGFQTSTDCAGNALPTTANAVSASMQGVTVNRPPQQGLHTGDLEYVEVSTTRAMRTTFSAVVGQSCWMVSARAVAHMPTSSAARCSFCALNNSSDNHTLVLDNGATLRVDGDIYVNSTNGGTSAADCAGDKVKEWKVCGDGFDIFGAGGLITARTISVVGGWETHDDNPTQADSLALQNTSTGLPCSPASATCVPCPLAIDPPSQAMLYPAMIPSRVCIHTPKLPDPLNDPTDPKNLVTPPSVGSMSTPVAGVNGCPSGASVPNAATGKMADIGAGVHTICPGKYVDGITIKNAARVTMMPGIYYMVGGGFQVTDDSWIDGSSGVMVYNSSGSASAISTSIGTDFVPACNPSLPSQCRTPGGVQLSSLDSTGHSETSPAINQPITLRMIVDKGGGSTASPSGMVTFHDGETVIGGCSNVALQPIPGEATKKSASCVTSWPVWGTHNIASAYLGDAIYKPVGDTVRITIPPPSGSGIGPVTIDTTGNVKLFGLTSGPYAGLTIFQERGTVQTVTINPGSGAAACGGTWLTTDVPDVPGVDPPAACGPLGGIRGTIYAPASGALVLIESSGLAELQVISGMIQITSDADTRFSFTPQFFAKGKIRLVD